MIRQKPGPIAHDLLAGMQDAGILRAFGAYTPQSRTRG